MITVSKGDVKRLSQIINQHYMDEVDTACSCLSAEEIERQEYLSPDFQNGELRTLFSLQDRFERASANNMGLPLDAEEHEVLIKTLEQFKEGVDREVEEAADTARALNLVLTQAKSFQNKLEAMAIIFQQIEDAPEEIMGDLSTIQKVAAALDFIAGNDILEPEEQELVDQLLS